MIAEAKTPKLTVQEEALAYVMHSGAARTLIEYTMDTEGQRYHTYPEFQSRDFNSLVGRYKGNPKDSLAYARQALFGIHTDRKLNAGQKERRLSRYLDAYFDLQVHLDRAAFPETPYGQSVTGVPSYIPDGLVDMGSDSRLDSRKRFGRERIHVDKRQILGTYKDLFETVFSQDISGMSSTEVKTRIVNTVLYGVYSRMSYDYANEFLRRLDNGDAMSISLSDLERGVCRHHALVTQVLLQAFGITSRLLKNDVENNGYGGPHAANLVRIDNDWYLADATQPLIRADKKWRPALFRLPEVPDKNRTQIFRFSTPDGTRTYKTRYNMHWTIERGPRGRYRQSTIDLTGK